MEQIPQKQHYLPAVYLKQFSTDGDNANRESLIWRLAGKSHASVPVETQCHRRFFNSALRPIEAEKFFQKAEGEYGEFASRIWQHLPARHERDYFGAIILAVSIHLRNPAYEVRLKKIDRLGAYFLLEQQFAHHVFFRGEEHELSLDAMRDVFYRNWRVYILTNNEKAPLITSDNPCLLYGTEIGAEGDPNFILLPITPKHCLIAYDQSRVDVSNLTLSVQDVTQLNIAQYRSMLNAVYSYQPFDQEDRDAALTYWPLHAPPRGFIDDDFWQMNVIRYTGEFTFVRRAEAAIDS